MIKAVKAVQIRLMPRLFRALCFALFALALGAQAMVTLERGDFALVTLGQCLALLYWPDPTGASAALDAFAGETGGVGSILAIPAVIAFGALFILVRLLTRRWTR